MKFDLDGLAVSKSTLDVRNDAIGSDFHNLGALADVTAGQDADKCALLNRCCFGHGLPYIEMDGGAGYEAEAFRPVQTSQVDPAPVALLGC